MVKLHPLSVRILLFLIFLSISRLKDSLIFLTAQSEADLTLPEVPEDGKKVDYCVKF